MSTPMPPASPLKTLVLSLMFVAAYLCASWLDLATTALALARPGTAEANAFVVRDGVYDAAIAWLVTALGGLVVTAYFAFGVHNLHRMSPHWLAHPLRSFFNVWSNPLMSIPWPASVIDRSPVHAISVAVAFVALRLVAAVNNALIATVGDGPLSFAIRQAGQHTSPIGAVILVVWVCYVVLMLIAAPEIARRMRRGIETPAEQCRA